MTLTFKMETSMDSIQQKRRMEVLSGELSFPKAFDKYLQLSEDKHLIIEELFQHVWHNFLSNKDTSILEHYEKFDNENIFNQCLKVLSSLGWVTITIENNYAKINIDDRKILKFVSAEELNNVKFNKKFHHYRLTYTKPFSARLVKIGNTIKETGLVREGFRRVGAIPFKYDRAMILKYAEKIAYNIVKDMVSMYEVSYNECVEELINYYGIVDDTYSLGQNISDSRGRAIFQCTKRVFNPVSSKDARACIICPSQKLTDKGWNNVYAFIAELNGYKAKNWYDKINQGKSMYEHRTMPDISKDLSDLHAVIWLDRIYNKIDNYNDDWDIPIEVDATASLVQVLSVLTNNHEYMDLTNLINGDELKDMWRLPYCSRLHIKKAVTPRLYGSNKEPAELWAANQLEYTQDLVNQVTKEIREGRFSYANKFKDFVISEVKPKDTMKVRIWDEEFTIYCNRFKADKIKTQEYWVYTSNQDKVKRCTRNITYVPDLEQFHRYFQTLLIHNLDSQVANWICLNIDWILPNHDAFTVHPNDADDVRNLYTSKLMEIYKNRHTILKNYLQSIGIANKMWKDKDSIEIGSFNGMCLK